MAGVAYGVPHSLLGAHPERFHLVSPLPPLPLPSPPLEAQRLISLYHTDAR
jgi:hypothetical protein